MVDTVLGQPRDFQLTASTSSIAPDPVFENRELIENQTDQQDTIDNRVLPQQQHFFRNPLTSIANTLNPYIKPLTQTERAIHRGAWAVIIGTGNNYNANLPFAIRTPISIMTGFAIFVGITLLSDDPFRKQELKSGV